MEQRQISDSHITRKFALTLLTPIWLKPKSSDRISNVILKLGFQISTFLLKGNNSNMDRNPQKEQETTVMWGSSQGTSEYKTF